MGYIDVSAEVLTFFLSILLGILFCILYTILRVLHKIWFKGFFEVLVTDLLFWFLCAFITFCFFILRCNGFVRGFVLFGAIIGFVITHFTVSKFLLKIFDVSLMFCLRVLHTVSRFINRIFSHLLRKLEKCLLVLKKVLQDMILLLYNQLKYMLRKKGDRTSGNTD